ncbi:MAG: DUF3501 family protein [Rhodocyclaceae bacterium]|jgi:hypothetical protein|nr:DUF3501 family protein [Rhodocyclaceae bacterium]
MNPLTRDQLFSLEQYARVRPEFRARVIAHKKKRVVALGPSATLHFEDRLTMQYQVQEMLRLERIFEPELIQEELDVYNPLIPDGTNWKATFMLEFPDETERKAQLARLIGIERAIWVQVADFARVAPIANEDLDRETPDKTASVHFLRFELTPEMIKAVKDGAPIRVGIDHPHYQAETTLTPATRDSLAADLA